MNKPFFFSVVSPSYNQSDFIEKTILSVLKQNYHSFEHIVIDGKSTDGTIEILKKYPHLKWISEPDESKTHAVNKGLRMATGDIIAWINSDDYYPPGVFQIVAQWFSEHPEQSVLAGRAVVVDASGHVLFEQEEPRDQGYTHEGMVQFWKYPTLPQPAIFFRKDVLSKVGYLDEQYSSYMDYDFFLRLSRKYQFGRSSDVFAHIRVHPNASSVKDLTSGTLHKQLFKISRTYWEDFWTLKFWKYLFSYLICWPLLCWRVYYERFAFAVRKELNVHFSHQISATDMKRIWPFFFKYPPAFVAAGFKTIGRLIKRKRGRD